MQNLYYHGIIKYLMKSKKKDFKRYIQNTVMKCHWKHTLDGKFIFLIMKIMLFHVFLFWNITIFLKFLLEKKYIYEFLTLYIFLILFTISVSSI